MTCYAAAGARPGVSSGPRAPAAGRRRRQPSDRQLHAYVDGVLDEARTAEVEAALHRDPALRRTVHCYRMLNHVVHLLYDEPLHEPLPDRLRQLLSRRSGRST